MEPALPLLGMHGSVADPREIATALLLTAVQLGLITLVFRPLEDWFPAERWTDRRLTRVDRSYTLLMLLCIFPLTSYLVLVPLAHLFGDGGDPQALYGLKHWVPWFEAHPLLLFGVYYVAYDFVYYWMHRAQHAIPWWWALHSMHHSQRQLSCWSNDRGSYLDAILQSLILASVGVLLGVSPSEFAALMLIGELVQNFSHANVRFGFGRWLDKLFVDPKFHRLHHMHVDPHRPDLHNSNFGQVLPAWDLMFGTALYGEPSRPTGITDPVIDADNDYGLIGMQWHALKRFWGAVRRPTGWKPGEVAFGSGYEPIPVDHARRPSPASTDTKALRNVADA